MFSTLKKERSQKFAWELPTEFAGSTRNVIKIVGKHQINQSKQKKSQKKYV
jgi:hypothetical protein